MTRYLTREEFEELMQSPEWTENQRALFKQFTPVIEFNKIQRFRDEMRRPYGLVEVISNA